MAWYERYKQHKTCEKRYMENYCLQNGVQEERGIGACPKMEKRCRIIFDWWKVAAFYNFNSIINLRLMWILWQFDDFLLAIFEVYNLGILGQFEPTICK